MKIELLLLRKCLLRLDHESDTKHPQHQPFAQRKRLKYRCIKILNTHLNAVQKQGCRDMCQYQHGTEPNGNRKRLSAALLQNCFFATKVLRHKEKLFFAPLCLRGKPNPIKSRLVPRSANNLCIDRHISRSPEFFPCLKVPTIPRARRPSPMYRGICSVYTLSYHAQVLIGIALPWRSNNQVKHRLPADRW